ncbi:MAG: AGE family epimerase/isomerase [Prolixibacteraceae bacterium]
MNLPSIIALIFIFSGCSPALKDQTPTTKPISPTAIEAAIHQHLDHFYPALFDSINGGYYTNLDFDWTRSKNQDKMLVTQARDLWMASMAAQTFPANDLYQKAAKHGYEFITQKMWDNEKGGFHLNYSITNTQKKEQYKLLYGNAFVLFALAEYSKIDSSLALRQWMTKSFNWMEENAHDNKFGGYFNVMLTEELKTNTPENKALIKKMGWGDPSWKDQNTSIHLLEAFTTLYRVMPEQDFQTRLKEMLILVRDTMTRDNGSLKLYFTQDWHPIDHSDSSKAYILKNQGTDHVSFGHNIETAYLLIDASKALYGTVDSTTLAVAKKLCDHTIRYGFDQNFYGLYDRGYIFDDQMEIIDRKKSWWAQYEAWHTLSLMSNYFPSDTVYLTAFQNMWNYINTELVDSTYGGQYNYGIDTAPKNRQQQKAHAWKGPYHDGRALMLVWEYLKNGQLKIDN